MVVSRGELVEIGGGFRVPDVISQGGARLVEVGTVIAGYGIMSMGAGEAHILNVCVRDDFRGRGIARQLMLYLIDRAQTAGMYEAFLEVRPSNTIAARLYHALGFQHELQNPFDEIPWDLPKVYAQYGAPPNNWSKEDVD